MRRGDYMECVCLKLVSKDREARAVVVGSQSVVDVRRDEMFVFGASK